MLPEQRARDLGKPPVYLLGARSLGFGRESRSEQKRRSAIEQDSVSLVAPRRLVGDGEPV
jgi:hypothetical protein